MNILIITQIVDEKDPVLGFFCDWLSRFAKRYTKVTVITLSVGSYTLPQNVEVFSLGKNEGKGRLTYLARFFSLIIKKRGEYDLVFVHMNPIYVVLAGWYWRLLGKPIFLWYTHRQIDIKLRLATLCVSRVFTASPEGFQLKTHKRVVLGHGINPLRFVCAEKRNNFSGEHSILHVGRITPIKNISVLLEALMLLRARGVVARVTLVGPASTKVEVEEKKNLQKYIEKNSLEKQVTFVGPVSFGQLPSFFCAHEVSVNLAPTGGMDKAVLESLFCGTPAFFSNKTFQSLFHPYAEVFCFREGDAGDLAQKLEYFWSMERIEKDKLSGSLQSRAQKEHNLSNLIDNIYQHGLT